MSDPCGCIYVGAFSQPEVYRSSRPTARKEHKCGECYRTIQPGEKYEYVFGVWDGDYMDTFKTCIDCLSIRGAFFCEGYYHGEMMEFVREHIREIDGKVGFDCLEELTDKAREGVLKIMEEVLEDLDV